MFVRWNEDESVRHTNTHTHMHTQTRSFAYSLSHTRPNLTELRSWAHFELCVVCCVCVRRMCMIAYPCYNIFTFLCYYFVLGRKSNASTPTVKPRLSKNICFYSPSLPTSLFRLLACLPACLLSMLTIHFAHNLYLSYRFRYKHTRTPNRIWTVAVGSRAQQHTKTQSKWKTDRRRERGREREYFSCSGFS